MEIKNGKKTKKKKKTEKKRKKTRFMRRNLSEELNIQMFLCITFHRWWNGWKYANDDGPGSINEVC